MKNKNRKHLKYLEWSRKMQQLSASIQFSTSYPKINQKIKRKKQQFILVPGIGATTNFVNYSLGKEHCVSMKRLCCCRGRKQRERLVRESAKGNQEDMNGIFGVLHKRKYNSKCQKLKHESETSQFTATTKEKIALKVNRTGTYQNHRASRVIK